MFRCFVIVCLLLLVSRVWAEELWAIEVSENNGVELSHELIPELDLESEQTSQNDIDDSVVENIVVQEPSEEYTIVPDWENEEVVEREPENINNISEDILVEEIVQEDYNSIEPLPIDTVVSDTEQRSIIVDWDKVIVMWK